MWRWRTRRRGQLVAVERRAAATGYREAISAFLERWRTRSRDLRHRLRPRVHRHAARRRPARATCGGEPPERARDPVAWRRAALAGARAAGRAAARPHAAAAKRAARGVPGDAVPRWPRARPRSGFGGRPTSALLIAAPRDRRRRGPRRRAADRDHRVAARAWNARIARAVMVDTSRSVRRAPTRRGWRSRRWRRSARSASRPPIFATRSTRAARWLAATPPATPRGRHHLGLPATASLDGEALRRVPAGVGVRLIRAGAQPAARGGDARRWSRGFRGGVWQPAMRASKRRDTSVTWTRAASDAGGSRG